MDPLADLDPDGPAMSDGLFGLPVSPDDARLVVLPVPWELTASYGRGTVSGPERILEGSHQVDLFLPDAPNAWRQGIAMDAVPEGLVERHAAVLDDALAILDAGEAHDDELRAALARVDDATAWMEQTVQARITHWLHQGRIPALLGGDHSTSYGAIAAAVEHFPALGVLHIDAHADLRPAYMGFQSSHASVMHNVLERTPLQRLVQVGIRDFGEVEWRRMRDEDRIRAFTWEVLARALADGIRWSDRCHQIVSELPDEVWISFDIDGLEPSLCPHTGTPVPGGLTWDHTMRLLQMLREHGKRVVGFDLVEVGNGTFDGNVGARLLYRLATLALVTA